MQVFVQIQRLALERFAEDNISVNKIETFVGKFRSHDYTMLVPLLTLDDDEVVMIVM